MTNPDTMNAAAVAIALLLILLGWIALDLRERRRSHRRLVADVIGVGRGIANMVAAGECAHVWHEDGPGFHLCVRPAEHTGPHLCGICEGGMER